MEKEIVSGDLSKELKYDVKFEAGMLVAKMAYDGKQAGADVAVKVKASAVLDALKAAIPGQIDDMVIDAAKAALGV